MGFRFLKLIVCLLLAWPLASPGWEHTRAGSSARARAQVLEEWQGGMAENPVVQRSIAYTYDLLSQLKKESRSAVATAEVGDIKYSLGPTGNRLSRATTTSIGTTPNLPGMVRTTPATGSQTFDANDRSGAPNVYDTAGQALRLDLDGDGTVDQAADSAYDYEGRLVYYRRAAQGSVPTTEVVLVYDGDGNRIRKQVRVLGVNSRNFTKYVVQPQSPTGYAQSLEEWTVSVPDSTSPAYALSRRYYYGTRLLRQDRVASAATDYYTYDGLGSVRTLVQLGGNGWTESANYVYDAFGVLIASPTSTANSYQYAGEYWDTDLGLYFLRARYYNPGDGRFLTMDTFQGNNSDPLSLHKYLYCHDNPVNGTDPTGHESVISINAGMIMSGLIRGGANIAASSGIKYATSRALGTKFDYSLQEGLWDFGAGIVVGGAAGAVNKSITKLASEYGSLRVLNFATYVGVPGGQGLVSTFEWAMKKEALDGQWPSQRQFFTVWAGASVISAVLNHMDRGAQLSAQKQAAGNFLRSYLFLNWISKPGAAPLEVRQFLNELSRNGGDRQLYLEIQAAMRLFRAWGAREMGAEDVGTLGSRVLEAITEIQAGLFGETSESIIENTVK